jgi:hypothetical protein
MPDAPSSRRLTTIVALDVAGYSARTEADEARTCVDEVSYDFKAECEKARGVPTQEFRF